MNTAHRDKACLNAIQVICSSLPKSNTMAYTLHPATVADAEDITRIFNAAFAEDHIMAHFHPHTPAHLKWEQDLEFFRMQLKECGRFGGRFTKVVEGSTG